jgi:hypothetical protein
MTPVKLTERDRRMLVKCAVCRWLTTDQLKRLYFPEATLNAVQKRLRKLAEAGYLRSHQEHPTAEAIHAVGPKGRPLVQEKGVEAAIGGEVPRQVEHMLLGVNEIRIAVETSGMKIVYFFAYWQLANLGWAHSVIPDAVFAVRTPELRTFLVEYDRSTETLDKLFRKLGVYDQGLAEFPFEAVLILTERTRRLDLLGRELRRKNLSLPVLVSNLGDVLSSGFFESAFVGLPGGERRKILETPDEDLKA